MAASSSPSQPKVPKPPNPNAWRAPKEESSAIKSYLAFEEPPPPPPAADYVAACYHSEKWDNRVDAVAARYGDLLELEKVESVKIRQGEKHLAELAREVRNLVFPSPSVPEIVVSMGRKNKPAATHAAGSGGAAAAAAAAAPEPMTEQEEKRRTKMFNLLMKEFNKKKSVGGSASAAASTGVSPQASHLLLVPYGGGAADSGDAAAGNDGEGKLSGDALGIDEETWRKLRTLRETRYTIEANLHTSRTRKAVCEERRELLQVVMDLATYASASANRTKDALAGANAGLVVPQVQLAASVSFVGGAGGGGHAASARSAPGSSRVKSVHHL